MTQSALAYVEKIDVAEHQKEQLKIVIVGHVDHGKSTLVGRLFYETDSLPDGQYEKVRKSCESRGMPFEWSFLTDALQSERDQGITVDTTQIWFKTPKRDYVIIDAPGHKEFLKNMISGAASSEAALLIIDAKEGVKEQSKRHGYLLHLLGVRQIAVAVNKMDLVGYDEKTFRDIEKEYTAYLKDIGVTPKFIIPISAREGDNIVKKSENMKWYKGPAITEALDQFQQTPSLVQLPLRLPVQDVYKFDERRIIVGRIESGSLKVGDKIIFSPHNRVETVASIEFFNSPQQNEVYAGQSVGITLKNQIFVERGNIASHVEDAPKLSNIFRAKLFWLSDKPLEAGKKYKLKLSTAEYQVEVKEVEKVVDTNDLAHSDTKRLERSGVGEVIFRSRSQIVIDDFVDNARMGRFTVVDGYDTVGGGIIDTTGFPDQRKKTHSKSENLTTTDFKISRRERELAHGHRGGVLWFSGLSGSGKSTLANELQSRLFRKGYNVYVLDGDNVRQGLSSDLGFEHKDRSENLRRVAEVAALFADSGTIVITSFISPYKAERDNARAICGDNFHSVYIKADLKTVEARDPKGLYKKARKGEIKGFTGIDDPFEEPQNPDLVVENEKNSIEENLQILASYIDEHFIKPVREAKDFAGGEI
jgi:bifunctional enzyme CysN/CysC